MITAVQPLYLLDNLTQYLYSTYIIWSTTLLHNYSYWKSILYGAVFININLIENKWFLLGNYIKANNAIGI